MMVWDDDVIDGNERIGSDAEECNNYLESITKAKLH